jgi:hypothetical protein
MNNYILNEIRKIKDDNRRLQEELLAVKMENLKLNSIFVQLQHYPPHSLSTALAVSSSSRFSSDNTLKRERETEGQRDRDRERETEREAETETKRAPDELKRSAKG